MKYTDRVFITKSFFLLKKKRAYPIGVILVDRLWQANEMIELSTVVYRAHRQVTRVVGHGIWILVPESSDHTGATGWQLPVAPARRHPL